MLDILVSESVEGCVKLEVVKRNTVVPPFQDDLGQELIRKTIMIIAATTLTITGCGM